jgi:hypothetical protein
VLNRGWAWSLLGMSVGLGTGLAENGLVWLLAGLGTVWLGWVVLGLTGHELMGLDGHALGWSGHALLWVGMSICWAWSGLGMGWALIGLGYT